MILYNSVWYYAFSYIYFHEVLTHRQVWGQLLWGHGAFGDSSRPRCYMALAPVPQLSLSQWLHGSEMQLLFCAEWVKVPPLRAVRRIAWNGMEGMISACCKPFNFHSQQAEVQLTACIVGTTIPLHLKKNRCIFCVLSILTLSLSLRVSRHQTLLFVFDPRVFICMPVGGGQAEGLSEQCQGTPRLHKYHKTVIVSKKTGNNSLIISNLERIQLFLFIWECLPFPQWI